MFDKEMSSSSIFKQDIVASSQLILLFWLGKCFCLFFNHLLYLACLIEQVLVLLVLFEEKNTAITRSSNLSALLPLCNKI